MQGSAMYQQFQPQNNQLMMLQQIKQNPLAVLSQRFNIPQNIDTRDPNNIIQYLLNTNQISQDQVNRAAQMSAQFR